MNTRFAFVIFLTVLICAPSSLAQIKRAYLGTWEGDSLCQAHPSSCQDEHVIITISPLKASANKTKLDYELTMNADKVVAGKRDNMGTLGCSVQNGNSKSDSFLQCHVIARSRDAQDKKNSFHPTPPYPDVWEFHLSPDKQAMAGTLVLRGELFRKLTLKRRK